MASWFDRSMMLPVALTLAASAGCVEPKHPKLHITQASFTGVDLQIRPLSVRLHLDLQVAAENPNRFDIQVRNVRGQATIAGKHQIPVQLQPDTWLTAKETTTFSVPIAVPAEMLPSLAAEALLSSCVSYKFEGEVDLVATSTFKLERDSYPLSKDGCIEREKLLKVIKP